MSETVNECETARVRDGELHGLVMCLSTVTRGVYNRLKRNNSTSASGGGGTALGGSAGGGQQVLRQSLSTPVTLQLTSTTDAQVPCFLRVVKSVKDPFQKGFRRIV